MKDDDKKGPDPGAGGGAIQIPISERSTVAQSNAQYGEQLRVQEEEEKQRQRAAERLQVADRIVSYSNNRSRSKNRNLPNTQTFSLVRQGVDRVAEGARYIAEVAGERGLQAQQLIQQQINQPDSELRQGIQVAGQVAVKAGSAATNFGSYVINGFADLARYIWDHREVVGNIYQLVRDAFRALNSFIAEQAREGSQTRRVFRLTAETAAIVGRNVAQLASYTGHQLIAGGQVFAPMVLRSGRQLGVLGQDMLRKGRYVILYSSTALAEKAAKALPKILKALEDVTSLITGNTSKILRAVFTAGNSLRRMYRAMEQYMQEYAEWQMEDQLQVEEAQTIQEEEEVKEPAIQYQQNQPVKKKKPQISEEEIKQRAEETVASRKAAMQARRYNLAEKSKAKVAEIKALEAQFIKLVERRERAAQKRRNQVYAKNRKLLQKVQKIMPDFEQGVAALEMAKEDGEELKVMERDVVGAQVIAIQEAILENENRLLEVEQEEVEEIAKQADQIAEQKQQVAEQMPEIAEEIKNPEFDRVVENVVGQVIVQGTDGRQHTISASQIQEKPIDFLYRAAQNPIKPSRVVDKAGNPVYYERKTKYD